MLKRYIHNSLCKDASVSAGLDTQARVSVSRRVFHDIYGHFYEAAACAGGRVNFIGEHVDYPDAQFEGSNPAHLFSMGGAVRQSYITAVSRRNDQSIHLYHLDEEEKCELSLDDIPGLSETACNERRNRVPAAKRTLPSWANHSLGGIFHASRILKKKFTGINILLTSNVPFGAGMSNSAANCVSLGLALQEVFPELGIGDPFRLAEFARNSENHDFAGGNCGWLDQLLIVFSKKNSLTMLDYAEKKITHFASNFPPDFLCFAVNTNVPHVLGESDYILRVAELSTLHTVLSNVLTQQITSVSFSLQDVNRLLRDFDPSVPEPVLPVSCSNNVSADNGSCVISSLNNDTLPKINELILSDDDIVVIKNYIQTNYQKPDFEPHNHLTKEQSFALLIRRMRHQKISSILVPAAGHAAMIGNTKKFGELINCEGRSLRMTGDFQITGKNGAQDFLLDSGFIAGVETGMPVYGRMLGGGGGNVLFFIPGTNKAAVSEWKERTAARYSSWTVKVFGRNIEPTVIIPEISNGAHTLIAQG